MAKIKKFGTFSGVFTPSILTILGVIMYLRFPTIIGQAGLINTIGIIVIAHIISVTTSLSVASLSTDKTVKTGGTYFMISRSLGLPIGGTLGLALFVGLSFSVSLYLIGFAESFLTYWNLDTTINSVRITGTIILILVTTITFISTSLAIKSQYFIMAAIVLSLLSIFLGHHEFAPREIHLKPLADAAPFMVLFGIFFPAVTGFEAGVSMSGDLKDAKKSLPVGAMAAVGVGFVVYLGLALFYAFTVDAEVLRNDSQVLFKISLVPVLVIIGIWGATLSSALGSILGAPRILQAIAMDKIAPKVFAKGTGKTKEPRNALLLAFVIAEAGILIGQLDVIARIVSMFFITTYAFLNLASAIESWSSSDFRPAFKIPRFVSLLGAVSAFIVMILLDFIALAGAVVVLGLLFFILKRKELTLETGDAWSSFWTNLAKRALLKLTKDKAETRNWRPNIVLFSGGKQVRPHLVELGMAMSGKLGALTDFELVINDNPYHQLGTLKTTSADKNEHHFFNRQFVTDSIENGIKTVTNVYGFSGFEPNTIMMGWSRETKNADFLANVLTHFKKKNLNAAFLDYDKNSGFGKKQNIDIWWNGKGRHLSFALNLMRFILADAEWRDANLRILVINKDNTLTEKLYKNTTALLEEKRISAVVKIISDDFGTRSKEMIINSESANADLIVLGISQKTSEYTGHYIKSVSQISELPASILILSPSNEFEEINIIGTPVKRTRAEISEIEIKELNPIPAIENKIIKTRIEKLDSEMLLFTGNFIGKTINDAVLQQQVFIKTLKDYFELNIKQLERNLEYYKGLQLEKEVAKLRQAFFVFSTGLFEKQGIKMLSEIKSSLHIGISAFKNKTGNYIFESPETIIVPLTDQNSGKEKNVSFPYQKMVAFSIHNKLFPEAMKHLLAFENETARFYTDLKNIILQVNDIFEKRETSAKDFFAELQKGKQLILLQLAEIETTLQNLAAQSKSELLNLVRNQVVEISTDLQNSGSRVSIRKKLNKKHGSEIENLEIFPEEWESGSLILNHSAFLDCLVLSEQIKIEGIIQNYTDKVNSIVTENLGAPVEAILSNIESHEKTKTGTLKKVSFNDVASLRLLFQDTYFKISEVLEKLPQEIEISEFSFNENEPVNRVENFPAMVVEPYKIARYYFDTKLYEPFYRELEQLDIMVKQAVVECREANSLLKFRLENFQPGNEQNLLEKNDMAEFLKSLKKQVKNEKIKLDEAIDRIRVKADEMVKNAIAPLYSHSIIQSEKKISSLLRDQKSRRLSLGIFKRMNQLKEKINSLVVGILYSSSGGVIQAKKLIKKRPEKITVGQILDITEREMPNQKVLSRIPVFYRTLFSSKSFINDDFWVSMENETAIFKNALQRHKNGYGGAVLITGVHGSGKTALTRYFANHYFKKDRIYTMNAPVAGSVKMEEWHAQLQEVTGRTGDSNEIFRSLEHESLVVINDLELWWERSNNGYAILKEITELIRIFGRKTFFVVNCNKYSYNIINKVFPLDDSFLSVVESNPFNARKLQQLIQSRHKTSGLTFYYKNRPEESVTQIRLAALFNSYFNYSEGVPGVAINAWLSNIIKVEGQNIYIRKPEMPDVEMLEKMNEDWLVLVALFVQHKNINAEKLARILEITPVEAEKRIDNLSNAGILEQRVNNAFTLGRYIEPFLVKIVAEKGII